MWYNNSSREVDMVYVKIYWVRMTLDENKNRARRGKVGN